MIGLAKSNGIDLHKETCNDEIYNTNYKRNYDNNELRFDEEAKFIKKIRRTGIRLQLEEGRTPDSHKRYKTHYRYCWAINAFIS